MNKNINTNICIYTTKLVTKSLSASQSRLSEQSRWRQAHFFLCFWAAVGTSEGSMPINQLVGGRRYFRLIKEREGRFIFLCRGWNKHAGRSGWRETPASPINQCTNTKPIIGGSKSTEGDELSRVEDRVLNAGILRWAPGLFTGWKLRSPPRHCCMSLFLPLPPLPPGESQVLASDDQEMSRPGWTADDDTVLLFSHLEKSFTAVCVSFHPSFCFLSQEIKIPCRTAMAPGECFLKTGPRLEVIFEGLHTEKKLFCLNVSCADPGTDTSSLWVTAHIGKWSKLEEKKSGSFAIFGVIVDQL